MLSFTHAMRLSAQKTLFLTAIIALAHSVFPTAPAWADDEDNPIQLAPVAVTANPLGLPSDQLVVPVSTLNGHELSRARESTLGETLKNIPGVSASYFGPSASRPIIRGMDGERVRIMQNGIGVLDASSLSFDHAVAVDPLVIEQIDVVRGPAALLYGGNAVGGVVNAIDHRIPQEPLDGVTGRSEISFAGANNQKNGAIVLDAGNNQIAIHADIYGRESGNLDIPGYPNSRRKRQEQAAAGKTGDELTGGRRGRLPNSFNRGGGGALGAALTFDNGYAGISYANFNNKYGMTNEEGAVIDQNSDRWDLASEFRDLGSIVDRIKVHLAHTDYVHKELDDGEVATTFKNRGLEGALEIGHAAIGKMSGTVGLQFQHSDFSALGEEAFVPGTTTTNKALYIYEELPINALKLSFGGRVERNRVRSEGGEDFGSAQSRNFNPHSLALGGLYQLSPDWAIATNLSHNQRAPSYFELFANGLHAATDTYEIGSSKLKEERTNGIDAQLRWKSGHNAFNFGGYYTRFDNFIGLFASGREVNEAGLAGQADSDIEEFNYRAARADFKGLETDGRFRIYDGRGNLDLTVRGDYVRARNRDSGADIPRISPLRLGFGLHYNFDRFSSSIDVLHGFKQRHTDQFERSTSGYTSVNASATYRLPTTVNLEAFAKSYNLLDAEIRDHSSLLKDIAPQRGRSLLIGLRSDF